VSNIFVYTVLAGDTLSGIVAGIDAASGVSVAAIETANPGVSAGDLQIGMLLNIPNQSGSGIALKYTVQPGDSYSNIAPNLAACAGVTYQQIEQANPGVDPNILQLGQVLSIPSASRPQPQPQPQPEPGEAWLGFWYWTWSKAA
jgi:LysM repeat protein